MHVPIGVLGSAGGAEHLAFPGLQHSLEHLAALAGLRVFHPSAGVSVVQFGVEKLRRGGWVFRRELQRRYGSRSRGRATRKAAAARTPRRAPRAPPVAFVGDDPGVLVSTLERPSANCPAPISDRLKHVERLEPEDDGWACRSQAGSTHTGARRRPYDTSPGPMNASSSRRALEEGPRRGVDGDVVTDEREIPEALGRPA